MRFTGVKVEQCPQRGQATVEYVLLLVVVVAIISGSVYQLNDAFRVYAENYFGAYLECLLSYGELPSLGYESDTESECDGKFQQFTIAGGRAPKEGDGSQSDSSQTGEDTQGQDDGGKNAKSAGAPSGQGASESTAAGSADGGEVGRFQPLLSSRGRQTTQAVGKSSRPKGDDRGRGLGGSGELGPIDASGLDGRSVVERELTPRERQLLKGSRSVPPDIVENGSGSNLKPRKFSEPLPDKSPPPSIDTDTTFTIGNFLKYLIIAAIIIALVIFLGGQAVQISKSWEK